MDKQELIEQIKIENNTAQKARLVNEFLKSNDRKELYSLYHERTVSQYCQISNILSKIQKEDEKLAEEILEGREPFSWSTAIKIAKIHKKNGATYSGIYKQIQYNPPKKKPTMKPAMKPTIKPRIKQEAVFDPNQAKTDILVLNIEMWVNQLQDYINQINRECLPADKNSQLKSALNKLDKKIKKVRRQIL